MSKVTQNTLLNHRTCDENIATMEVALLSFSFRWADTVGFSLSKTCAGTCKSKKARPCEKTIRELRLRSRKFSQQLRMFKYSYGVPDKFVIRMIKERSQKGNYNRKSPRYFLAYQNLENNEINIQNLKINSWLFINYGTGKVVNLLERERNLLI